MMIAIPTMGRVNLQHTLSALDDCGYPVLLFCPEDEVERHRKMGRIAVSVPAEISGIAATRMFIMDNLPDNKIVMMDDDLTFAVRRADNPTLFRPAEPEDVKHMLQDLDNLLDNHSHVSVAMREGANRDCRPLRYCCRVARVIGYRKDDFVRSGADFRNSTVMDDFEVTLHLLTRGYPNAVLNKYVQNQRGSGTAGGASLYRTMEMHAAAATTLAARYPRYVKTVQKTTAVAWGGGTRTDVVVQWKKAYEEKINARDA